MNSDNGSDRSRKRWNLITIAAFFVAPPVGVGLIVARVLDLLPNIGGKVDVSKMKVNIPDEWLKPKTPVKKREQTGLPKGGSFLTVLGYLIAGCFAAAAISTLTQPHFPDFSFYATLVSYLSIVSGGLVLAFWGGLRKKKQQRFETYIKLIGEQQAISIHALADAVGTDYKKTIRDLQEMITRGILSPAWLDLKNYRLMLTEFDAQAVPVPGSEEKKDECISRSEQILRQIRADNDLIADEEVSDKIDRIEDLTRKIFEIVDKYPEKEKQLTSFLNYYLPTTLKALESYARMEAQGIETDSIREAKHKINLMLDELANGYEKQLDKLFENDVVDISADIEVMRQMLQRDGLTEDEITRR